MNAEQIERWLDVYAKAWRERDSKAVAALFTEQSVYKSHPFREPHLGQEGVRAYWARATGDQRELDLRFGTPVIEGSRVAVEWWAIMKVEGSGVGTLPGCLVLRFAPDGRCEELREYWHWQEERVEAPEGWGR
jgi:limonene-1,2-epoxide hydrolase